MYDFRPCYAKTMPFYLITTVCISRNGMAVGYLSRGGFGYTINKSLGTGYVDLKGKDQCQSVRDFVLKGRYQIDVMGEMYDADVRLQPLFDPNKAKGRLLPMSASWVMF